MSESWDDYTSGTDAVAETSAVDTSALDSGNVAQDWSNWNTESANEWQDSADSATYYGDLAASQGDLAGAQYEYNLAENYQTEATSYGETASDYQSTADSNYETYAADVSSAGDVDTGDITSIL